MPQVFHPYADTVARDRFIAIVVVPFVGIGFAYWISALRIRDRPDASRSISQSRSATSITSAGSASIAAIATPASRLPPSPACRRPTPA